MISSPLEPNTNIFVPSVLKANEVGVVSCPATENRSAFPANTAVDTSKGVERSYSLISSPIIPITNILIPLVLKTKDCGDVSYPATENRSASPA